MSFIATPPEIRDEILRYLCKSDLESFSLCSKDCRYAALPFLFAGLGIVPGSAAAFGDGGVLCSLRHYVRKIYLKGKTYSRVQGTTSEDIVRHIEEFRCCIQSLYLFPSVTSVYVEHGTFLWDNLSIALWKGISTNLPNLKEVQQRRLRYEDSSCRQDFEHIYPLLSSETQQFIGPEEVWFRYGGIKISDFFQRSIEVLHISKEPMMLYHPKWQYKYLNDFPIESSMDTLRYLYISTDCLMVGRIYALTESTELTIFPNLVGVKIYDHFDTTLAYTMLEWCSGHCPSLREFGFQLPSIIGLDYTEGVEYRELLQVPKLSKVSMPWLKGASSVRYKRRELEVVIRRLVDSGMDDLREISFYRGPPSSDPANRYIIRRCRITKDQTGRLRLLWRRPFYEGAERNSDIEEEEDGGDSGDDLGPDENQLWGVE